MVCDKYAYDLMMGGFLPAFRKKPFPNCYILSHVFD
jgi:hypothetical protein